MKPHKAIILILLIFLVSLAFRLYFSFQTEQYSDSDSYFHIRYIEYIKETYKPMNYDPLSFGGRQRQVTQVPFFDYVLAGLSFIPYAYKIIPAVFISLTVIVSYFLALKLTEDNIAALLSALMTAFLPSILVPTLNKISVLSLILPLVLYMVYCLIRIEEEAFLNQFVILCFILPVIHPLALLVSASFVIYIILVASEPSLKLSSLRKEAIIFSIFLALLIEFIIYKKAFLALGFSIVWQNIPSQMILEQLEKANLLDLVYSIGIIPFILGIVGIILGITKDKTHSILITVSIAIAPLALLALKMFTLSNALIVLGPILAITSAITMKKFFTYLRITKFSKYEELSKYLTLILITLVIIIPAWFTAEQVIQDTITKDEITVLKQLGSETSSEMIIASSAEEGHYVTYFAERKDVIDKNFLYVPNIDARYNDIKMLYTTIANSEALEITHKYGIDYIYLSPRTKKIFGIEELNYATDGKCFRKVADVGEVEAYKVRC